jgi:hypothetical protein
MADKDIKDFMKRRSQLAGLTSVNFSSALKDIGDTDSYLQRRLRLSGSVLTAGTVKPSKISDVAKKIIKKSPVGRVIDAGTKLGLGAAAGYEYAKSKFKDKDKDKKEKVDKKKLGGMNKSKLKKAAMMGTALLASNYLGKRAGENAVIDSINSGQAFKPEGAKRTPFGVSLNEGGEVEIVKGQDYIKDLL